MDLMKTILLVDKPAGWTSFDVVAKLRGQLKATYRAQGITPTKRQLKVGHAGTLDPFATGLLVLLFGEGTRQAETFLKLDKTYEATVLLGSVSTTGDPEGDVSPYVKSDSLPGSIPTEQQIRETLLQFEGTITQTPPAYSAIKIDGKRAYDLARAGKEVVIPARTVTIYSIELLSYEYPELRIRTHVSSGTYIRTLAEDIGQALGVGAYCRDLRRLTIGEWHIEDARTVVDIISSPKIGG